MLRKLLMYTAVILLPACSLNQDYLPAPVPFFWQGKEDTLNWNIVVHNDMVDDVRDVAVDSAGFVYVLGTSGGIVRENGVLTDWWIKKFDDRGVEIKAGWDKKFIFTGSGTNEPQCVFVDDADAVWVGGWFSDGSAVDQSAVIKYAPGGEELLRITVPAAFGERLVELSVDSRGNLYFCATSPYQAYTAYLYKYDARGAFAWRNQLKDGSHTRFAATALALDPLGDIIVGGYGYNLVSGDSGIDSWVKRFTPAGDERPGFVFSAELADGSPSPVYSHAYLYDLVVDSNSNIFTAGCGYGIVTASGTSCSCYAGWINGFSPAGERIFEKRCLKEDSHDCRIRAVVLAPNGDIFATGSDTYAHGTTGSYWILQGFNRSGAELWSDAFDLHFDSAFTGGRALAFGRSGGLYAVCTGKALFSGSSGNDWWMKKFY